MPDRSGIKSSWHCRKRNSLGHALRLASSAQRAPKPAFGACQFSRSRILLPSRQLLDADTHDTDEVRSVLSSLPGYWNNRLTSSLQYYRWPPNPISRSSRSVSTLPVASIQKRRRIQGALASIGEQNNIWNKWLMKDYEYRHKALLPPSIRHLQDCACIMAQAQGYRQPCPPTIQGHHCHALGTF